MKKTPKSRTNAPHNKKPARPNTRGKTSKPIHPRSDKPKRNEKSQRSSAPRANMIKFPIYGQHAVEAAWLNPARQIHELYLTENSAPNFESLIIKASKKGLTRPTPKFVDKDTLDRMLPMGAVHQGITISCAPLAESDAQELAIKEEDKQRSVLLMLDQVTDPHNVGAILRSACAFGAGGVIMQRKHAPELNGVLAKIATGAIEHLPVAQETNLSRALENLKDQGYYIIGLDEHDTNQIGDIDTAKYEKIVLILGSEGEGMRRLIREHCDIIAQLPVPGPIKSLNVSNAAAVALFSVMNA